MSALPAALVEKLKNPLNIELSRELWVAAAVLGLLRTTVNDSHREETRDRGQSYNILNDLQGALGELIGIHLIEDLKESGIRQEVKGLLDLEKSVNLADLTVVDGPRVVFIDVKCHFDKPWKKLFLINEKAHERSIARGVRAFLPIVAAEWHRNAIVGKPIPIENLLSWKLDTVGEYGDPSRQLDLTNLEQEFFDNRGLYWVRKREGQWGELMLENNQVVELRRTVNSSMLDRLRRSGFSLDGYTYREIIMTLLSLLPQKLRDDLHLSETL